MTRLLPLLLALAACAATPTSVQLDGAETRGTADRPRVIAARMETARDNPEMELVSGDGVRFAGRLARVQRPVVVPLATVAVPEGGGTELVGDLASGSETLGCRFLLLNPARGIDGGGSGRCESAARRIEFTF